MTTTPTLAGRAYSRLTVKAMVEDGRRIVRGMATTPGVDRMGDVVDPMGVSYDKELPFLWQHRHDAPIGWVKFGKPTKAGIPFEAEVATCEEEGELKAFLDKCWQTISLGLVKAVSIGFRAMKWAWIGDYDGIEYQEVEVYELSAVTIPANAEAVITEVSSAKSAPDLVACVLKGFDAGAPAVSARPTPPTTADRFLAALPDFTDEVEAASGQKTTQPEEPAKRGHVAKLAKPARAGAPFVINRIHPAR